MKTLFESSGTEPLQKPNENALPENDFVLSHKEAKAASPVDMAVCGEEDPGEGLEFLVAGEDTEAS